MLKTVWLDREQVGGEPLMIFASSNFFTFENCSALKK
jgi:hypothetical protein